MYLKLDLPGQPEVDAALPGNVRGVAEPERCPVYPPSPEEHLYPVRLGTDLGRGQNEPGNRTADFSSRVYLPGFRPFWGSPILTHNHREISDMRPQTEVPSSNSSWHVTACFVPNRESETPIAIGDTTTTGCVIV